METVLRPTLRTHSNVIPLIPSLLEAKNFASTNISSIASLLTPSGVYWMFPILTIPDAVEIVRKFR
jgi:hypothetical protein